MRRHVWIKGYLFRQQRRLVLILGITVAASAVTALQPWPLKFLADYALGQRPAPGWLQALIAGPGLEVTPVMLVLAAAAGSLALFAAGSALEAALSLLWTRAGQRMLYDVAADLFQRLQRLSLLFHSRRPVGDSLGRLTEDAYGVYTLAEALLVSPLRHLLTLTIIGVIAWRLDPQLTLLSFAVAPAMCILALLLGARLKRRSRLSREAQSRLLSFVHQTLTAIPVVQAFDAGPRNRRQFSSLAEDAVALSQRGAILNGAVVLAGGVSNSAGMAIVLYFGGLRVLAGDLTVGGLLVFVAYVRSMQAAISGLLTIYGKLKTAEASLDRVAEILDTREMVNEAPGAPLLPRHLQGKRGHLLIAEVSFGYEPDRPVLAEVSLEAESGEAIALVGPTGAGKTTLVSLILRFFDPWKGRILINGSDIRKVQLASLRDQVAWVPQDPMLLPLTVAENIRYGRPEAGDAEVRAAAVAARAHDFIERLPEGYETLIGQRGATLSGGERQRLSIARALLKDAAVLILDEPTSALDADTETLLMEALENLTRDRTTIIIAHRLSTVRKADWIVRMEQGRIVRKGRPEEVLGTPGMQPHLIADRLEPIPGEVKR
jgi:ATP-binding cassette, subfamily B, bacterial